MNLYFINIMSYSFFFLSILCFMYIYVCKYNFLYMHITLTSRVTSSVPRGVVVGWNKDFCTLVKDMMKQHFTSFVILMETHTYGEKPKGIIRCIGLWGTFVEVARGHSGGMWCLWDTNVWKVDILRSSQQFVHMLVTWRNSIYWLLTASGLWSSPVCS